MIKTFMKHTLLDYCITVACDRIIDNFTTPTTPHAIEEFHRHWRNLGVKGRNQLNAVRDYNVLRKSLGDCDVLDLAYFEMQVERHNNKYLEMCRRNGTERNSPSLKGCYFCIVNFEVWNHFWKLVHHFLSMKSHAWFNFIFIIN